MQLEDFLREAGNIYEEYISQLDDADYEIDPVQMKLFSDIVTVFHALATNGNGVLDPIRLEPRRRNGGITAYFDLVDLSGDMLGYFLRVLAPCSAVSIDATTDCKVCISATIPGVFKRKQ